MRLININSVKKGVYVELISIFWMIVEAVVAISGGIMAHSLAMVVFGADSIIELVAGFILLWRLTVEMRGQSSEKVRKAEKTASWVVGIALLVLALYVLISAVYNLFNHNNAEASITGIILAVMAGIIMPVLSRAKIKIGESIGSKALKADGFCSMVCAYMSWILLADVVLTALFHDLWWIDAVISLAFIYFIIKEGIEAIRSAIDEKDGCNCCKD